MPQSGRKTIGAPLHSGVLAIDALTPIGRGQCARSAPSEEVGVSRGELGTFGYFTALYHFVNCVGGDTVFWACLSSGAAPRTAGIKETSRVSNTNCPALPNFPMLWLLCTSWFIFEVFVISNPKILRRLKSTPHVRAQVHAALWPGPPAGRFGALGPRGAHARGRSQGRRAQRARAHGACRGTQGE